MQSVATDPADGHGKGISKDMVGTQSAKNVWAKTPGHWVKLDHLMQWGKK